MKVNKKNFVFTLFIMVLLGVIAANSNYATVQAFEVSGFYQYETSDAGVTITKYTGGELSVTIPSKIAGKKVTTIGYGAFSDNDIIEHVKIPTTVTAIYGGAFYDCDSLLEITIPDSVTTLDSAGWGNNETFGKCDNLTTVIIGDGVTDLKDNCFIECSKLEKVTIGNSVTAIGTSVFENCDSLKSITIPASVKSIGLHCFHDCDNLNNVGLSNGLEVINGGAFYDCDSLQEIIIPNSVTTIESAGWGDNETFGLCDNLTTVVIGDGVTDLKENCFISCPSLAKVTIGKSVTTMGTSVFENCDSLKSITIPASVKELGLHSFWDCNNLNSVTLSYGLEVIRGGAFYNCNSLSEMIIPNSVITLDSAGWGDHETFGKCTSLVRLQIPNSVSTIGEALVNESQSVIIYGYANSIAAQYATDNSIPFQELPSLPADKFSFNESEILLMAGEKQVLDYTIQPENTTDAIIWKSSDENIASVDNIGIVTAKNQGSVSIIATTTSGKKGSMTLIIQEAPRSISFKTAAKTLAIKQSYTQKALLDDGGRTDVTITYKSSNSSVAAVDKKGKVTAKKEGTVTITAQIFNGLKTTYQVTVKKAPSAVALTPNKVTLNVKNAYTLKTKITTGSYTSKYNFVSSNSKVVTVDSKGKIVAKKKGTATVTVTTHNGKKATCKVTVK
jgi:uncharacterized protein YjdB